MEWTEAAITGDDGTEVPGSWMAYWPPPSHLTEHASTCGEKEIEFRERPRQPCGWSCSNTKYHMHVQCNFCEKICLTDTEPSFSQTDQELHNWLRAQNRRWAPRGGACLVYGQCHNSLLIWPPYSPILWCTFWVGQFLWHTFEIILSILCVVFADMQKAILIALDAKLAPHKRHQLSFS